MTGNDFVLAESGRASVDLGEGNDKLLAYSADVDVDGGAGDDVIHGGSGNDTIDGGQGNDVMSMAAMARIRSFTTTTAAPTRSLISTRRRTFWT